MPDTRRHRGAHPEDAESFGPTAVPRLREAVAHLSWLLTRGYAEKSALKLVGDRFSLLRRQRIGVMRCAAADLAVARRAENCVDPKTVAGRVVWIDGFNLLTTIEAALSDGVILLGRDGCYRDMASMHGSYRKVYETLPAIEQIGESLSELGIKQATWYLDSPVSNSGRLKKILLDAAAARGWDWHVEVVPDPDPVLIAAPEIVASADSAILGACEVWLNLARLTVNRSIPQAWIVDLSAKEA